VHRVNSFWSIAQKRRYLDMVQSALRRLRSTPSIGRSRDDLKVGYRSVIAGQHVVVYRIGVHVVEVVSIVHGSMDIVDQLPDAPPARDESEPEP